MRPRERVDSSPEAVQRDVLAWQRASNRLVALATADMPIDLQQEVWQLMRHAQLLAETLRQAMARRVCVRTEAKRASATANACQRCVCCIDMGDRLLVLHTQATNSLLEVASWRQLVCEIDAGLLGLLASLSDGPGCEAELQRLRARLFAESQMLQEASPGINKCASR